MILIGHISKFQDNWKKVLAKTPQKIIKELAVAVQYYYSEDIDGETPLHYLALKGNLESYKFLCQNREDKNPISEASLCCKNRSDRNCKIHT